MDDAFVTVDLTESEYDALVEWLSEEQIGSGLGKLYDRLLESVELKNEDQE